MTANATEPAHWQTDRDFKKKPTPHGYECCSYSGAGNCHCGASERSFAHPHRFTPALVSVENGEVPLLCVCSKPEDDTLHVLGTIWL